MGRFGAVLEVNTGDVEAIRKIGSIGGSPQIVNSPFGKSMNFDGVDDSIKFYKDFVPIGGNNYSISLWFKAEDQVSSSRNMLSQWTSAGSGRSFFIGLQNYDNIRFSDSWSNRDIGTWDIDKWHNLVCVSTSSNAYIYFDGVLKATRGSPLTYDALGDLWLGRQGEYAAEYFKGVMDNILVFDRAITQDEVTKIYENKSFDYEKNCVLSLDMSNTNPVDLSGNGNDGTSTGTTIVNSFDGGKATNFNGGSDYINCGNDSSLSFGTEDFSLSSWIKFSSIGTVQLPIDKKLNSGTYNGYSLQISATGNIEIVLRDSVTLQATSPLAYNDGEWHLIMGVRSGDNLYIYVDGDLKDTQSGASSYDADVSQALGIGARTTSQYHFNGLIDKVKIYNKALTSLQIKDIYNKQKRGLQ